MEAVQTLEDLLGVLDDNDYAAPTPVHRSVLAALAYFADAKDVIPDDIPMVGFLDDAIMIRLVEDELKHESGATASSATFREGAEQRPWSMIAKATPAGPPQGEARREFAPQIREREEQDSVA